MKFGILYNIDYHEDVHGSQAQYYETILQQVERLDELGYDSVWFGEHHYGKYSFSVPSLMCLAAAQRTTDIRVGTGVSLLPLQHPVRQAEEFAMLDVLTGGRVEYGVGRGFLKWGYDIMGVDEAESVERYYEALEIITSIYHSDGPVSFTGEHWDVRDFELFPRPIQDPLPIYSSGASTLDSYAFAGRMGVNLATAFFVPKQDTVRKGIASYREELRKQGIDPNDREVLAVVPMYCAETEEEARQSFEYTQNYLGFFGGLDARSPHRADSYKEYIAEPTRAGATQYGLPTFDDWDKANLSLIGTPDRIIEKIQWYNDYYDHPDHLLLEVAQGGMPPELVIPTIERFAENVMSKFKDS